MKKKLIPYIQAYLIVAAGTAIYPRIYLHFTSHPASVFPHNSVAVVLNPGLSHDELVAKLQQVGLSEAHAQPLPTQISPFTFIPLLYHFIFDAVMLSAFAALVILFQRAFRADISSHADAA